MTPIFKFQTYLDGLMFSVRFGMRFSMRFGALYIIAPGPTVIVCCKILAVP